MQLEIAGATREARVYEVLVYFNEAIPGPGDTAYAARACTRALEDGRWSGWLEFSCSGDDWRATGVETIQPNRRAVEYWVTGLTRVYLEGALERALRGSTGDPAARRASGPAASPRSADAPGQAEPGAQTSPRTILDPFSVYAQGEAILRAELGALSPDHLRNIAAAFNLESPETASTLNASELRDRIVAAARSRASRASNPELSA